MKHVYWLTLLPVIGCVQTHTPSEGGVTSIEGVGEGCVPSAVPVDGFQDSEIYLESSSPACESTLCLVDHLYGNPQHICERASSDPVDCVDPSIAAERSYCTCRCGPGTTLSPLCTCAAGFTCIPFGFNVGSFCARSELHDGG